MQEECFSHILRRGGKGSGGCLVVVAQARSPGFNSQQRQLFTVTFTPITDFLLIEWSQCTWLSTFIKATAFHYSFFCYLDYPTQSLLVQKYRFSSFWMAQLLLISFLYSGLSAPELLLLQNLQLYSTAHSVTKITWHKVYPTNDDDDCGSNIGGLLWHFESTYT